MCGEISGVDKLINFKNISAHVCCGGAFQMSMSINMFFLLGNLSQQAGHPPDIPASKLAHSALFSSHRLQVTQLCPLLGPSSRPASRLFRFSVEQWQRGISQVVPVFPATSCAQYS